MSHFYLTLPSNSSGKYYSKNTLTCFTTRLHSSVSLEGEWEVGLAEVSFPKTWYTIQRKGTAMNITCKDCTGVVPDFQGDVAIPSEYSIDLNIPPGYYETVKDVTDQLNTYVRKLFSSPVKVWQTDNKDNAIYAEKFIGDTYWPSFKYNDVNRRVYCSIPPNMTLKFSKEMTTLLGMRQQTITNNDKDTTLVKGHNVSDITTGIQNLHVYCDVLEMTLGRFAGSSAQNSSRFG